MVFGTQDANGNYYQPNNVGGIKLTGRQKIQRANK